MEEYESAQAYSDYRRKLAFRRVLAGFPNTLSGPFWRYQYFRDGLSKDEIRPVSAVHLLFTTALKPVQPEVRKCQNAIGSSSPTLIPAYRGGQPQPLRLVNANSPSQIGSPRLA